MWLFDSCLLLSPGSEPHCTGTSSILQHPHPHPALTISLVPDSMLRKGQL